MSQRLIESKEAPAPIGPYSQAIDAGQMVFLSGQIPLDPRTGELVNADVSAETHQVMKNIGAVLKAARLDFRDIVKTTIFLQDMNDFAAVNEVYGSYLSKPYPARETVEVAKLPKGVKVEISCIAIKPI